MIAIDDDGVSVTDLAREARDCANHGHSQRGGQQRRVRGGGPVDHDRAEQMLPVEADRVGRGELLNDQHAWAGELGQAPWPFRAELPDQQPAEFDKALGTSGEVVFTKGCDSTRPSLGAAKLPAIYWSRGMTL